MIIQRKYPNMVSMRYIFYLNIVFYSLKMNGWPFRETPISFATAAQTWASSSRGSGNICTVFLNNLTLVSQVCINPKNISTKYCVIIFLATFSIVTDSKLGVVVSDFSQYCTNTASSCHCHPQSREGCSSRHRCSPGRDLLSRCWKMKDLAAFADWQKRNFLHDIWIKIDTKQKFSCSVDIAVNKLIRTCNRSRARCSSLPGQSCRCRTEIRIFSVIIFVFFKPSSIHLLNDSLWTLLDDSKKISPR